VKRFASLAVLLLFPAVLLAQDTAPQPPVAPTRPFTYEFQGRSISDPYHWLKEKSNPEVIAYIKSENAYRESLTKSLKPFEERLYSEMLSHIKQTDLSVPVRDNGYWYYSRTVEGKQYPIFCRKAGSLTGAEEILLDVNQLAEGKKFLSVRPVGASDDGRLYAYLSDVTGFREYYLSIKDLRTGRVLENNFVKVSDVEWAGDNRTLFYVIEDAAKRPFKLFRHVVGQPKAQDAFLYEEKDGNYNLAVSRTHDKKFVVHSSESSNTTEQHVLDRDTPTGEFRLVAPRTVGVEYTVDHRDGLFHIRTNKDGAINFKWMTCPAAEIMSGKTDPRGWRDFEPYRPDVFLEHLVPFKDYAVVAEREAGITQLRVYDFHSQTAYRVSFPERSYTVELGANPEYDTRDIHFNYTSLVTPLSVFDFDLATRERRLLKATEVPGGFDPKNYVTERVAATAADGAKVPLSIVYRKGLVKDGKAPVFLYGYGSYGITTDPEFDPSRLVLLDRGVVFAMAHIRGGADMGRNWYLDGKLMHKKNTFTDFIACADYLVNEKYGSRDRLAIEGRSAGGLLIGATLNFRPDLCKVAHLGVPFVDLINTMLDESLPLTTQEFLEWGNPKQPAAGRYMREYSPYDNLARTAYPAILVTTSLNDSQVLYHEPTKYVARLRTLKTDKNPLILKCNMDAGHGGASGRYEALHEKAYELSFILTQLGVAK
jgi:oligopeptidase B